MLRKRDTYFFRMTGSITLGKEERVVITGKPQSSLRVERLKVTVDGSVIVPCNEFLYLEAITLNGIPIQWLSINHNPVSKFCRLRDASYDLERVQDWAMTPRIWPCVRVGGKANGTHQVAIRNSGKIPEGGREGEEIGITFEFTGPA